MPATPLRAHVNRLLLGLSLRFSYNHLLFNPTLAFPFDGVGVLGALLELLSMNRLLFASGLPLPSKLILFDADPLTAPRNNGLPVFGENGEFDVDLPMLSIARGLPDRGDCRSIGVPKLFRGVERW
jgi:hypothetical protein